MTAALEKRNLELEAKFKDMSELYLKAQETEKELRDELAGCVTISEHQANRLGVLSGKGLAGGVGM